MSNNGLFKQRSLYFFKCLMGIFAVLLVLYYLSNSILPIVTIYKQEMLDVISFFQSNAIILLITLAGTLLIFFLIRSTMKKIRFLFSEETTDKDIYDQCVEAWKKGQYDVVYDNMNYIYEMSQKDDIKTVYSETAKAILLFQKTDFFNKDITKEEIQYVISGLLNTFNYKELYLNTIHLAYAFLHLSKVEQKLEIKAINHLISYYLFNRVGPIENKNRIDIELRIFNSYFEKYKDTILQDINKEMIVILQNPDNGLNKKDFEDKVIPFLKSI